MPVVQRTVSVLHRQGLHARPAAIFVQVAKGFDSRVTAKKGRRCVDVKSIMGLMTLAAKPGSRISVVVDGPDAHEALEQLCRLLTEPLAEGPTKAPHTI